jgi:hypothetical protein
MVATKGEEKVQLLQEPKTISDIDLKRKVTDFKLNFPDPNAAKVTKQKT